MVWPCSVVTLLSELYIVESKIQVYGALHAFLRGNEAALTALHKTILFIYVVIEPNSSN